MSRTASRARPALSPYLRAIVHRPAHPLGGSVISPAISSPLTTRDIRAPLHRATRRHWRASSSRLSPGKSPTTDRIRSQVFPPDGLTDEIPRAIAQGAFWHPQATESGPFVQTLVEYIGDAAD